MQPPMDASVHRNTPHQDIVPKPNFSNFDCSMYVCPPSCFLEETRPELHRRRRSEITPGSYRQKNTRDNTQTDTHTHTHTPLGRFSRPPFSINNEEPANLNSERCTRMRLWEHTSLRDLSQYSQNPSLCACVPPLLLGEKKIGSESHSRA